MAYNIYRFTNSKELTNHGVVINLLDHGANVLMDEFDTSEKNTLPARYCYVSFEKNPFVMAETKNDLLHINHPIAWHEQEISNIVKLMQSGKFEDWWIENQERVVKKFIGGYKKD